VSIAPKKKNNKKKKGGKGKSNSDTVKEQDVEKDTAAENGDGDGDVEDDDQSGVVRMTPVHLPNVERQGRTGTDYINRIPQRTRNSQKYRNHKPTVIATSQQVMATVWSNLTKQDSESQTLWKIV
jgi:hypothetical protein